jgi:hypothetical protein
MTAIARRHTFIGPANRATGRPSLLLEGLFPLAALTTGVIRGVRYAIPCLTQTWPETPSA